MSELVTTTTSHSCIKQKDADKETGKTEYFAAVCTHHNLYFVF